MIIESLARNNAGLFDAPVLAAPAVQADSVAMTPRAELVSNGLLLLIKTASNWLQERGHAFTDWQCDAQIGRNEDKRDLCIAIHLSKEGCGTHRFDCWISFADGTCSAQKSELPPNAIPEPTAVDAPLKEIVC